MMDFCDDEDLLDPFPEFAAWTHCIPFLTEDQTARVIERLKRHAVRGDNGCICWDGARNKQNLYGKMNIRNYGNHRQYYVHRLSWWLANGRELPFYMEVAHGCDNPSCFNPKHVEAQRRAHNRRDSAINTNIKRALKHAEWMGGEA